VNKKVRASTWVTALVLLLFTTSSAQAAIVVVGPLAYEHELQPGRSVEGTLEVRNPEDQPQEVKFYQTDYRFFADGSTEYGEPGRLPRSNARWITIQPKQAVIPPGERLIVRYTIRVPDDPTLKGTYWSLLMVEPVPAGSPESSTPDPKQTKLAVREVMRYAVQIAAHIGSTGRRELKFVQFRLLEEGGRRRLAVDVENTGERMLNWFFWTDIYDSGGKYLGKFEGGDRRLYPGTAARFKAELPGLEKSSYKALIVVDCGGDDVFGASDLLLAR